MSTLRVANLAFSTDSSVRINLSNTDNLTITTANVVANTVRAYATGLAANTFYDYGNTSFYFSPSGNSRANVVQYNTMALGLTKPCGEPGVGAFAMWSGDKVYIAQSLSPVTNFYGTGRTAAAQTESISLQRMVRLSNPYETTEPIDAGVNHQFSYALYANGNLYTWGNNAHGQCGLGTTAITGTPTLAAVGVTNVYIHPSNNQYTYYSKLIVKKSDGMLYAAGYNTNGQLGVGDTTNRSTLTLIPNSGNTISVWNMGGDYGTLVIQKSDYTIWACGYNTYGSLGDSSTTTRNYLVNVTSNWGGGTNITLKKVIGGYGMYDAAGYGYSFQGMLLDDGVNTYLYTSGYNGYGSVGNGTLTGTISTPITPTGLPSKRIYDVTASGGGSGTIMCLYEDGDLYVWGYNGAGQLGNGTSTSNGTPTYVTGGVSRIFGDGHYGTSYPYRSVSFYKKNGVLYGAGYNADGQCGLGHVTTPVTTFTRVRLPDDFDCQYITKQGTAGGYSGYTFFSSDGRLAACGYNGQKFISSDTTIAARTPIEIRPPTGG